MDFGKKLAELRLAKGRSQVDIAQELGIAKSTYHGYENNKREPDIQKIRTICNVLGVTADELLELADGQKHYSDEDLEVIGKYSELDSFGKRVVSTIIDIEIERMKGTSSSMGGEFIYIDELSSPTEYSESGFYPAVKIKRTALSEKADFMIRMIGDSMLPRFINGDKLLVMRQNSLQSGDLGVFTVNSKLYIRQFGVDRLISLNTDFRDIFLSECGSFEIIGKILGKL